MGQNDADQQEAGEGPSGVVERLALFADGLVGAQKGLQAEHTQDHHEEVGHVERHGHRPELAVKREVVEKEVIKGRKVFAPGHHDRQGGGRQEPDLQRSLDQESAQQEEEHEYGAEVHGAADEGLFAPVVRGIRLRQLVGQLRIAGVDALQDLDRLRAAIGGKALVAGSAHVVRDHQRKGLQQAVAPAEGIFFRKSALSGQGARRGSLLRQFRLAADRFLRVFIGRPKPAGIGSEGDPDGQHQYAGSRGEAGQGLLPDGIAQHDQSEYAGHQQEVVGDLHVVGVHLQAHEQGGQGASEQVFSAEGQQYAGDRGRHISQGDHLGRVAGQYEVHKMCGKPEPDGARHRYAPVDPQHDQQEVYARHHQEDAGMRGRHSVPQQERLEHILEHVAGLVQDLVGRHAGKHGIRPERILARLRLHLSHFGLHAEGLNVVGLL